MIANGVPVSFDYTMILSVFGMILAAYAVLWVFPRLRSIFVR